MSNIIKFPRSEQAEPAPPVPVPGAAPPVEPATVSSAKGKAFLAGVLRFVWIAVVLVWPVLKWLVSIEVFFQFIRMIYQVRRKTPSFRAGI